MTARSLTSGVALAAILAIGMTVGAKAQEGQWRGDEPGMRQQWQGEGPGRFQRQGQGERPGMSQDDGQDEDSGPPEGWQGDGQRMRPGEWREERPGMRMMREKMMGHAMMRKHAPLKIMFAILDTNGDGALSFEEIMTAHKRIFDAIDVNKDGKITVEEVEAFLRN
ncbi:EF-hand domain-containing protein [Mesorhizobium sp. ANAO-SY3R2]|uniref:EF-hand domain-containing protein n=1 Tax=Mesorhizobium sp. ANAO-SY3R2 TaxID=3166644 RepID=UPI00367192FC